MTLTNKQFRHVKSLQDRILALQDETARFISYLLDESNEDPSKQYILVGKELIEQQTTSPMKIQ